MQEQEPNQSGQPGQSGQPDTVASPGRRLVEFLGLRSSIVGMLAMVLLVGMGERMAERFLPLYILAVGGGTLAIGLLGGMQNLLSALYSFPGGYLADRMGTRRALLLFDLVAIVGYLIVILVPSWYAVLVGAVFFMAWSAISLPASMGVIVKALPAGKQVMGVSMHSLVSRVPKALGPLLGGVLVTLFGEQEGIRIAFMVAIGLVVVAIVIQQTLLSSSLDAATVERPERNPWRLWQRFDRPLRHLLLADILLRFCEQIPNAFVILWCMQVIAAPIDAWQFGVLTTVEMVTSALIYIPVARFADQGNKKTFVLVTFVFFTLFPFVLLVSQTFSLLLVAFVVRGLKEFGEPTRKAMILSLAPEGHKAGAFGLYYLMRDTVVSLAAFGGAVLWQIDPALNLWVAGGFGCMATLWFAWRGKDVTPALPRPGMKA